MVWLALLAQAQVMVGGPGLFLLLKLAVVGAVALAVLIALRYRRNYPGEFAERCLDVLGLTLQGCVLLLTITSLGNVHVAAQIMSATVGAG